MVQSQEVFSLTIGRLASAGGVGVETVRFYQRRGLLSTPTRETGIRRYDADDLRRLRFIKQALKRHGSPAEITGPCPILASFDGLTIDAS